MIEIKSKNMKIDLYPTDDYNEIIIQMEQNGVHKKIKIPLSIFDDVKDGKTLYVDNKHVFSPIDNSENGKEVFFGMDDDYFWYGSKSVKYGKSAYDFDVMDNINPIEIKSIVNRFEDAIRSKFNKTIYKYNKLMDKYFSGVNDE